MSQRYLSPLRFRSLLQLETLEDRSLLNAAPVGTGFLLEQAFEQVDYVHKAPDAQERMEPWLQNEELYKRMKYRELFPEAIPAEPKEDPSVSPVEPREELKPGPWTPPEPEPSPLPPVVPPNETQPTAPVAPEPEARIAPELPKDTPSIPDAKVPETPAPTVSTPDLPAPIGIDNEGAAQQSLRMASDSASSETAAVVPSQPATVALSTEAPPSGTSSSTVIGDQGMPAFSMAEREELFISYPEAISRSGGVVVLEAQSAEAIASIDSVMANGSFAQGDLLTAGASLDFASLDSGFQTLIHQLGQGPSIAESAAQGQLTFHLMAAALAVVATETARRQLKRSRKDAPSVGQEASTLTLSGTLQLPVG